MKKINQKTKRNNRPALTLLITWLIAFVFVIGMKIVDVNANRAASTSMKREYLSIEVEPGDSLCSIAKRYMGAGYANVDEYIKDIKEVNDLKSNTVYSGKNIIVPRYVSIEE